MQSPSEPQTEECPFFFKVGSCRHRARCIRSHELPEHSAAIMIEDVLPPQPKIAQSDLMHMIQELFIEISMVKPIQEIVVAANTSPHLQGCVLMSFGSNQDAEDVLENINSRWFAGKPVLAHYIPAGVLTGSICREGASCRRSLDCSYVHPASLPQEFWHTLFSAQLQQQE